MWTKNVSEERVILLEGRKRWTQRVIKEREREREMFATKGWASS